MTLRIHNTLSGTKDEIIPGGEEKENIQDYPPVTIYSCGPTVYSYAHIGNFRTFLLNDLLRRYLKFKGFAVNHAMNITDVDDKTLAGSREEGISLKEYTERYTAFFLEDLASLNIETVEHIPKATESMKAMEEILQKLQDKGYVYEKDGSLYFSIGKYENYGRLSKLDTREIQTGLRYDTDEYEKDDIRDFVLWKAPKDGEEKWKIDCGEGRPGWHIECSAMIRDIFNTTIDIHTGGVDLIFPHHENEIAQSEAAYDEPFVRHWVHWEHLLVDGTKMSKSKGNFYTLRDLTEKGYSTRSIRYLMLSAHYRKQLNFTFEGLTQASTALERIDNLLLRLSDIKSDKGDEKAVNETISTLMNSFSTALDDDLNTSGGFGALFDFIHSVNSLITEEKISIDQSTEIITALEKIDAVLGIIFSSSSENDVDEERIEALIIERKESKQNKNFARADEIRDTLLAEGIVLEDTKDGTRWKRKN